MVKEFWLNLPVKDIARSRAFFTEIGFLFRPGPGNTEHSATMEVGAKNIIIMLFAEPSFKHFTNSEIADTRQCAEVLFSIDAESREEVDEWVVKVQQAGGIIYSRPQESQGWMYGCGFADLDGHRWNVLFMDMMKSPKK